MDALALVLDLKGFAVIALAFAHVARHVDVGQKVHFYLDQAVTLTRLATSTLHVEGETSRTIASGAGFRYAGEQLANRRKQPSIGRRVRARGAADRALIDVDDLVQMLKPFDAVVSRRLQRARAVQGCRAERVERVVDQCGLART